MCPRATARASRELMNPDFQRQIRDNEKKKRKKQRHEKRVFKITEFMWKLLDIVGVIEIFIFRQNSGPSDLNHAHGHAQSKNLKISKKNPNVS